MKTKQEEIREGIEEALDYCEPNGHCDLKSCEECRTDNMLKVLHSKGLVIKVDRKLPTIDTTTDSYPVPCNETCHKSEQENMLKAGYVAVEPLVKEG